MDINDLLLNINKDFPDKAIDFYESIDLLLETIKDTMESINEKSSEEMKNRNFDKSIYYMQLAQELHTYESKLDKLLEDINIEDMQISDIEDKIDSKKELPNYEEYKVDDTIEHTLKEDFTHKRPCSFRIGESYTSIVNTWQEMILDTCKYLIKLDELRFKELVRNPKLNGRKSAYFSSDKKVMRRPVHIGSGIYIETNMSANSIRNLIIKLLKLYNIPTNNFKVYLRADYTNLNNQLCLEI
ncbi:hypothetical protein [Romboutsia sp. MSSM.1001216sp_RTP31141st1_G3_RTP31141_220114]|uniref:hypothetical protein n=1 Tax=unclassified Romboutsia TaxID=2626894 RepID=UPI0031B56EE3